MVNVVKLNRFRKDEQTISILEELLESAKLGKLESLMYVDKYHDNQCGYGWAGTPDYQMIGKLRALEHLYISAEQEE